MVEMRYKQKQWIGKRMFSVLLLVCILLTAAHTIQAKAANQDTIVLRIGNWEEYIDQGGWGEDETIDLDGQTITSEHGLISDFEEWYYQTYGKHVKIKYSTFGTNEDLYSKLILGETYDLVCPSEYMIMKMIKEDMLQPLSQSFFDTANGENYYAIGVSPYIKNLFETNQVDGKPLSRYMAGYMWGTIGLVYNPASVNEEDASTWSILTNTDYAKRITIKDSVRESYFPALAILNKDLLLSKDYRDNPDYATNLAKTLNDTSMETITKVEDLLQEIRLNVYSFETDSGKSDMVTGKIVANYQWSGDAVYAMDQAEEEGLKLNYSVPEECTNLWLDGWVMLKSGIRGDQEKQQAAEAFINFVSRPDNVVRNMYYIGYTSCISGGGDTTIYDYLKWNYESEDADTDTVEYPLGYFFSGNDSDPGYILTADQEQTKRQLFAQYPPQSVIRRSAIMGYFPDDINARLNQMWINVRCFNFDQVSRTGWLAVGSAIVTIFLLVLLVTKRQRIFQKPVKKGFERIRG